MPRSVGKAGKKSILSSTSCKNKKVKITGAFGFAERQDGAPVPPDSSISENVKCKK